MISIRNLSKVYGPVRAVDRVSLEIGKGEVVGLLGQNGAGKTTMMKMITGYLEPSAGSVSVGGIDVGDDRVGVQRLIGYLPENAPLYPEMLVQEYLLMMARLRGIPSAQQEAAVIKAVRATGLEKHVVQPIAFLSKGYRQRVGIAQAILHDPAVLILDEPTNGLDPVQILQIRKLILDLAKTTTVILSTHILQEVEAVCDRVLVLIGGKLVADGPLSSLLTSHVIRLEVGEGATDVDSRLKRIDGVTGVRLHDEAPSRDGFVVYAVDYDPATAPIPDIVRAGVEAGWTIGGVAAEQFSLQAVFQRLQQQQAAAMEATA